MLRDPLYRLSRRGQLRFRAFCGVLVPCLSILLSVPVTLIMSPAQAQPASQTAQGVAASAAGSDFVDGIAAVVDKDVITLRELQLRTGQIRAELLRQRIQPPDDAILQRQVLQRVIQERVEDHEAARLNIRVDSAQVEQAIQAIARRNNLSSEQMRQQVEASGTWEEYWRSLRRDILHDRLRQRVIDHTIVITDHEVQAFLKEQQAQRDIGATAGPRTDRLALAQILVRVAEGSSSDQVAALRRKADELLARVRRGEDFAALAAAASDGPEALEGGLMGARPADGWPDLFLDAVGSLTVGQVTDVIRSGNGFHILKVVDRQAASPAAAAVNVDARPIVAPQAPMPVPPHPDQDIDGHE